MWLDIQEQDADPERTGSCACNFVQCAKSLWHVDNCAIGHFEFRLVQMVAAQIEQRALL